jgi:hypothetical protein
MGLLHHLVAKVNRENHGADGLNDHRHRDESNCYKLQIGAFFIDTFHYGVPLLQECSGFIPEVPLYPSCGETQAGFANSTLSF